MPGNWCSVALCRNHSNSTNQDGLKLSFFHFPKNPSLQKKWLEKCRRKDVQNINFSNARICSEHFVNEDFEDLVKARILGVQPKKLKAEAVPSNNLLPPASDEAKRPVSKYMQKKYEEAENKQRQVEITGILENDVNSTCDVEEENNSTDDHATNMKDLQQELTMLNQKITELTHMNGQLMEDKKTLMKQLNKLEIENEKLHEKINQANLTIENLKTSNALVEGKMIDALSPCLSPNQIQILTKKKNRARWTSDELSKAFTLRYLSQKAYAYLRGTLKYPLPGLSTLRTWACNIDVRSGVLSDVMKIMDASGLSKSALQRCTVLSFDEMKITSVLEYDKKEDNVLGPHSYLQVIMARGLFNSWKQPVFVGFDKKMTKTLLFDIIKELYDIKFTVCACVSDCGGGNQGLWKELGISTEKTYFTNPSSESEKIFVFADVPHLLKLARNWFLDTGFTINNQSVNKTPVEELLKISKTEISSCFKLTNDHLTCERAQRQNVRLAAQLLSHTTSVALKQYLPGNDKELAKRTANFCETMNLWFDIMNSYTTHNNINHQKPYGQALNIQEPILNDVISMIQNMTCNGKKSMQVFQKGIITSTKSLMELFIDLKQKYDIEYILTHRLNQDCLENFFSQLRSRGGLHDHPSPLNVLYRIRTILLGKNPGIVSVNTNVAVAPEEFLTSKALHKAKVPIKIDDGDIDNVDEYIECIEGIEGEANSTIDLPDELSSSAEADGLCYVAGYLARKYKEKFPNLGTISRGQGHHDYSIPSWIQHLSFGGLTEPSPEWMDQVNSMEKCFLSLHGNDFAFKGKIVEETTNYVGKYCGENNIPYELVKGFCRQRIFIRIKYLNLKNQSVKRKTACTDPRSLKKMRKTIN
ncbi:hypothetical protein M8J75_006003 [Diaphorina citri]|nr:hypothetical protein M8J75_006003 [Diaphorina citri]KAI5720106.1 hypothetical protein M8J77_001945 [Diaphorina citri]